MRFASSIPALASPRIWGAVASHVYTTAYVGGTPPVGSVPRERARASAGSNAPGQPPHQGWPEVGPGREHGLARAGGDLGRRVGGNREPLRDAPGRTGGLGNLSPEPRAELERRLALALPHTGQGREP